MAFYAILAVLAQIRKRLKKAQIHGPNQPDPSEVPLLELLANKWRLGHHLLAVEAAI